MSPSEHSWLRPGFSGDLDVLYPSWVSLDPGLVRTGKGRVQDPYPETFPTVFRNPCEFILVSDNVKTTCCVYLRTTQEAELQKSNTKINLFRGNPLNPGVIETSVQGLVYGRLEESPLPYAPRGVQAERVPGLLCSLPLHSEGLWPGKPFLIWSPYQHMILQCTLQGLLRISNYFTLNLIRRKISGRSLLKVNLLGELRNRSLVVIVTTV